MRNKAARLSFTAVLSVVLGILASNTTLVAVSVKTLYSFCSAANCADGTSPFGGVIFDSTGNLYGTTLAATCLLGRGFCSVGKDAV